MELCRFVLAVLIAPQACFSVFVSEQETWGPEAPGSFVEDAEIGQSGAVGAESQSSFFPKNNDLFLQFVREKLGVNSTLTANVTPQPAVHINDNNAIAAAEAGTRRLTSMPAASLATEVRSDVLTRAPLAAHGVKSAKTSNGDQIPMSTVARAPSNLSAGPLNLSLPVSVLDITPRKPAPEIARVAEIPSSFPESSSILGSAVATPSEAALNEATSPAALEEEQPKTGLAAPAFVSVPSSPLRPLSNLETGATATSSLNSSEANDPFNLAVQNAADAMLNLKRINAEGELRSDREKAEISRAFQLAVRKAAEAMVSHDTDAAMLQHHQDVKTKPTPIKNIDQGVRDKLRQLSGWTSGRRLPSLHEDSSSLDDEEDKDLEADSQSLKRRKVHGLTEAADQSTKEQANADEVAVLQSLGQDLSEFKAQLDEQVSQVKEQLEAVSERVAKFDMLDEGLAKLGRTVTSALNP